MRRNAVVWLNGSATTNSVAHARAATRSRDSNSGVRKDAGMVDGAGVLREASSQPRGTRSGFLGSLFENRSDRLLQPPIITERGA
jgi:hypothetical protein